MTATEAVKNVQSRFSSPVGEKRLKIILKGCFIWNRIQFSSPVGEKRLKIDNDGIDLNFERDSFRPLSGKRD